MTPGRLFCGIQVCYGAFTALGSCGELLVASGASFIPPEVLTEISRLHASPWVHAWVVLQNLATLPLGLGFVISGLGLRRGRPWSLTWTRRCAAATLAILLAGQLVLSRFLYPDLRAGRLGLDDPDTWLVMLLSAGIAAMVWPLIALVAPLRAAATTDRPEP
jgi:hypothetical protein